MEENKLGKNLKDMRLKLNLTQEEVASIINKAPITYSRYERGTLKPDIDTLIELADLYYVSLDLLTGRTTKAETYLASFMPGYSLGGLIGDAIDRKKMTRKRATKRSKKAKEQ